LRCKASALYEESRSLDEISRLKKPRFTFKIKLAPKNTENILKRIQSSLPNLIGAVFLAIKPEAPACCVLRWASKAWYLSETWLWNDPPRLAVLIL
jgi:hypothetical protein